MQALVWIGALVTIAGLAFLVQDRRGEASPQSLDGGEVAVVALAMQSRERVRAEPFSVHGNRPEPSCGSAPDI